jgi:hypothetical protein
MKMYHASKSPKLDIDGIKINQKTLNSFYPKSDYIYLGTLRYILSQYFQYTPRGKYFMYEVDVTDIPLFDFNFIGQKRTSVKISPENVRKICAYRVGWPETKKKRFRRIRDE